MNTWYVKVLMSSGEYIYGVIRNSNINSSSELAETHFKGTTL